MDNQGFDPARNLWLQISSRRKGLGFWSEKSGTQTRRWSPSPLPAQADGL